MHNSVIFFRNTLLPGSGTGSSAPDEADQPRIEPGNKKAQRRRTDGLDKLAADACADCPVKARHHGRMNQKPFIGDAVHPEKHGAENSFSVMPEKKRG